MVFTGPANSWYYAIRESRFWSGPILSSILALNHRELTDLLYEFYDTVGDLVMWNFVRSVGCTGHQAFKGLGEGVISARAILPHEVLSSFVNTNGTRILDGENGAQ
ncbi:hypothetical protein DMENIID0001_070690 [Sergentomyia squamirostris]